MNRQPPLSKQATLHIPSSTGSSRRPWWFAGAAALFLLAFASVTQPLAKVFAQDRLRPSIAHINHLPYTAFAPMQATTAASSSTKAMKIGIDVDNWSGQASDPRFEASLVAMNPDFLSWHLMPSQETTANLAPMVLLCRKHGWGYTFNNEWANYNRNQSNLVHSDGTYRYDFADSTLQLLKDDPLFLGVIYDENELMQALNGVNSGGIIQPWLAQTTGMSNMVAFDAVAAKVKTLQQRYASYGKRLIFEEVFPDNAHVIARGGAIMAPKLLKETNNDLMYNVFRGAAVEYKSTELWTCIDLWFLNNFPTSGVGGNNFHTPQELYDALNFANAAGFDYAYVEQYKGLMDGNFNLTAYGQAVVAFQQNRANATRGDWRTVPVQLYVRRFPDGYWGQQYSNFIPDHPYGSWMGNPYHNQDKNWFTLLNTLSNGKIPVDADNWNAVNSPFYGTHSYFPLAGLPSMLIFDHYGTLPKGTGVPTLDLCGNSACTQ